VARKLAVIMHAMWRDGTEFRFKQPKEPTGHREGLSETR
jgi:hypothetical protein